MFSAPTQARAGFFSFVLGDKAQADTVGAGGPQSNSQTVGLLQANVSSASILRDKNSKNDKKDPKKDVSTVDPNADVSIVSDNAILPATGPTMGVSDNIDASSADDQTTSVYVVRKGDSIAQIAKMFDVSVNTILLANDMKKGDKLTEGQVLLILPVSGQEHTVTKGQTLQSIAKLYKVDVGDIAFYNGIPQDAQLSVGDVLTIPGADNMADEGGDKPAPNLGTSVSRDLNYYITHPLQNLVGYFINPLPTGHKTQGLHGPGHRGIDIGAPTGTPIYASASGDVLIVKTGCRVGRRSCGGGYGNMAIVAHPNGTKTLYAHMSKVAISNSDSVTQGQVIGYVGSTGRSTGPHLHFEVFNAKNPGADWSWANQN
jgi:LysM repeat protein